MDGIQQPHGDLRGALVAAAILLGAGLSIPSMFAKTPLGPGDRDLREALGNLMNIYPGACALAFVSPFGLLSACALVLFKPSVAYRLGGASGLAALPWFVLTESSNVVSTWSYLNGPDQFFEGYRPVAILKILSVTLLAMALTLSVLRLLPSATRRKFHSFGLAWPAIAVGVVVPLVWLYRSAMPWMLPVIVDGGRSPDLRILHITKRGTKLYETSVSTYRDGKFFSRQYGRSLFQYRFRGLDKDGIMPEAVYRRANDLAHSAALRNQRTRPAVSLRSWNAEGWYIFTLDSRIQAFTSEYGTTPPDEVRDLLEQIVKLSGEGQSFAIEDVCLGFCYDPGAGLGFWYLNDRCVTVEDGTTRCF